MARFMRRYHDPAGAQHGGMPTFAWRMVPDHLATRRQLRARGLRPGGQPVAAQLLWRGVGGERVAYLYRVDLARPVRPMTPARWRAIEAANRARRMCPSCKCDRGYVLPRHLGVCVPCSTA